MVEIPEIGLQELNSRGDFLFSRAAAHAARVSDEGSPEDRLHRACEATLLRDAACVAFLAGETEAARETCWRAGIHFSRLGLCVGATLLALADAKKALKWLKEHGRKGGDFSRHFALLRAGESEKQEHPIAGETHVSYRQLFSLHQCALLLIHLDEEPFESLRELVGKALPYRGGYPAGETGISFASYVNISDWLVSCRHAGSANQPTPSIEQSLRLMGDSRAEHIRIARADTFHWKLLLRPAELVDLDLLILFCLARNLRLDHEFVANCVWRDDADVVNRTPMMVAHELIPKTYPRPDPQPDQGNDSGTQNFLM